MSIKPVALRLIEKCYENSTGCWIWTGAQSKGYPKMTVAYRTLGAHRVAWELANGPIPDDLTIDHLCNTPLCIRVDHMVLASRVDNTMRGDGPTARNARQTHCRKGGHPLSGDNLYLAPKTGYRTCRACRQARKGRAA